MTNPLLVLHIHIEVPYHPQDPHYDVSADGQRILLPEKVSAERMIHVVQNWFTEFQDRR